MLRKLIAGIGCVALVAAACSSRPQASHPSSAPISVATSTSSGEVSTDVTIDPANFVATVTNPWYPLTPGSTWSYTGVRETEPANGTVTVTKDTKVVLGVRCTVVQDVLFLKGALAETTLDYYAQDREGNVWYFGEDTQELDAQGRIVSTEGSWLAGVGGARAGIIMTAHPQIGQSYRQEFYPGQAEDHAQVTSLSTSVTVPAGSFSNAQTTREWSPLEPNVIDQKFYVRGVGLVKELTARGPTEENDLVSFTLG